MTIQNLLLNFWLLFFFVVVLVQPWKIQNLSVFRMQINATSGCILLNLGILVALTIFIFTKDTAEYSVLNPILKSAFALLVIANVVWTSLFTDAKYKVFLSVLAVGIVLFRVLHPLAFSHNLLIIFALSWLGPFLVGTRAINVRRFFAISLIWFIYDIVYVWATPLAENLNAGTTSIGFPLAIIAGEALVGSGDLLWSGIFLTLLPNIQWKVRGLLALLISNTLVIYLINLGYSLSLFPLLVFWVPIGLLLLRLSNRKK